jgi:hypothetical protein
MAKNGPRCGSDLRCFDLTPSFSSASSVHWLAGVGQSGERSGKRHGQHEKEVQRKKFKIRF